MKITIEFEKEDMTILLTLLGPKILESLAIKNK